MRRSWIIGLLLLFTGPAGLCADRATAPADEFRAVLDQWVGVRTETAREQAAWRAAQEDLQRWRDLLERESAELDARLAALEVATGTAGDDRRAHLRRELDELDRLESQMRTTCARALEELRTVLPLVPEPLRRAKGLEEAAFEAASSGGVDAQMRAVLGILATWEALQNGVEVVREVMDVRGAPAEVDVAYIGLCRGFAVSPDDRWCAMGQPEGNAWRWYDLPPKMGGRVRGLLRQAGREDPPRLVVLPALPPADGAKP